MASRTPYKTEHCSPDSAQRIPAAMSARSVMLIVAAAALVLLAVAPVAESRLSCGEIYGEVSPCINGVLYGGEPPALCCQGIRNIIAEARSQADRQSICRCLKNSAQGISGVTIEATAVIPMKCKINTSYRIVASLDCNRFSLSLSPLLVHTSWCQVVNFVTPLFCTG